MILTVTLNAAMDRTLVVPNFAGGFRHRATDTYAMPGGKGVNVARTIKTLGQPVIATGLAGGGSRLRRCAGPDRGCRHRDQRIRPLDNVGRTESHAGEAGLPRQSSGSGGSRR